MNKIESTEIESTEIDTGDIIVPNWYDREDLEDIVGEEVSEEKFEQFKKYISQSDLPSEISNIIADMWTYFDNE